jgi:GH25 family lysozyme M1 (1,4-beta-N-acetylmuramidase)
MSGKAKKKNAGSWLLIRMLLVILVFLICFAVIWTWTLSQPKPNPFTSENFDYVNGYLTCKTEKSALGIDVSRYQGEVDWQKVREAGVEFAFIRLGYRSSEDGELSEDVMARKNLQGALAAGLEVGGYVFSQAMTPEEAKEEAVLAVSVVKDYEITLPLTFDWEFVEENRRTDTMTKELLTQCIHSFCGEVKKAGYEPMVYFNRDLSQRLVDIYELTNYQIWFAMYDSYPDAPCKPDYWQYTNQGKIPGIEGNVDLNLRFLGS